VPIVTITDSGTRPVGDPASVRRFDSDSFPVGIVPYRTFSRGLRFGRLCRIWHCVGLQRRGTASGERHDSGALTAAHRTLPFGTIVQVTNKNNGRSITVRINDRGPFTLGRVIDLTNAGAGELGMSNLAPVDLTVLSMPAKSTSPR
jgi:rare lipoprotein A